VLSAGMKEVPDSMFYGDVKLASVVLPEGITRINATGIKKTIYEDYLQKLPDNFCSGTNLWVALAPINLYYTGSGWGNTGTGSVYSVTIPVAFGDQIWATSFQKSGTNGGNVFSLSKLLGHSSLDITQNYINFLVSDIAHQVDEFNVLDKFYGREHIQIKRGNFNDINKGER
jgi:hypothetical protein